MTFVPGWTKPTTPGHGLQLEERLDFTERLLAQQRDASRLPAGREDR
jgi:hypothetical protein